MSRKAKLTAGIIVAVVVLAAGIALSVIITDVNASMQPIIVRDEESLVEAFSEVRDGTIVLGGDITVDGDLTLAHMNNFDLYGSTLTVNGDINIGSDGDRGNYFFGGDGDTEDGVPAGTLIAENITVNAPNAHIDWYENLSADSLTVTTAENSFVFRGTWIDGEEVDVPKSSVAITLRGGNLVIGSDADNVTYNVTVASGADSARVENAVTGENSFVVIGASSSVTVAGSVSVSAADGAENVAVDTEDGADVTLTGGTFGSVTGSAASVRVGGNATVTGDIVVGGEVTVDGTVNGNVQKVIEISTAEDFFALNDLSDSVAEDEKQYYVRLMNDIDLRDGKTHTWENNYNGNTVAVLRFAGVFDGNGKTITARNDLQALFAYAFGDVTFKDLTVEFDKGNLTRVVYASEYKIVGTKDNGKYIPHSESVRLTFDNVDYIASSEVDSGYYYDIGSNKNDALYYRSNCTEMAAYNNGKDISSCFDEAQKSEDSDEYLDFGIILNGCDVNANFTGGNTSGSDAGAAIFLAGQVYGTLIDMSDCSYTGMLVGTKVSLIFANASGTSAYMLPDGTFSNADTTAGNCRITISDVRLNGTIAALSELSSLTFSNTRVMNDGAITESAGVEDGEITYLGGDDSIGVTVDNGYYKVTQASESAGAEEYRLQLALGEIYWYDMPGDDNYEHYMAVTSNQLITIDVTDYVMNDDGVTDIRKVRPISLAQATEGKTFSDDNAGGKVIPTKTFDEDTLNSLVWHTDSIENLRYAFATVDGADYIVIDFEETGNNRVFTNIERESTATVYAYKDGLPVAYAQEN